MVRSQVRRGRPGRRLQSLGNPRIDVYRAPSVRENTLNLHSTSSDAAVSAVAFPPVLEMWR